MKRVLLVGAGKIAHMPFANFYAEAFSAVGAEVHLIYWNRDGGTDSLPSSKVVLHEFLRPQLDEVAKWRKVMPYVAYRHFVLKQISRGNFDLIVSMHTMPSIAIADYLVGWGSVPFVFDFRDTTFERFCVFRSLVGLIARRSKVTFVSSDAFTEFFPASAPLQRSHNLAYLTSALGSVTRGAPRFRLPIRIRFWGLIRRGAANRALIEALCNDTRFELHFHGREEQSASELRNLALERNAVNVFFHGPYVPEERALFAAEAEMVHNLYDNDPTMKYAVSNKFYDAVMFRLPQLCNKGSHMGSLVEREGVGFACDPRDPRFADDILAYFENVPWMQFEERCDDVLNRTQAEYAAGVQMLQRILGAAGRSDI